MFLVKMEDGSYMPMYKSDIDASAKIKVGEEVSASKKRNIQFHRKAFALLNLAFHNQDRYENIDFLREVLTLEAGYYVEGIDLRGNKLLKAKSWSFESMPQDEFENLYKALKHVIVRWLNVTDKQIEKEINQYY